MRDWEQFVAERLAHIKLTPAVRREVVAEIAAHLAECHLQLLRDGKPDAEARTMAQVSDWDGFCRKVRRAKEDPMSFVSKVLIPGAGAVILAMAALKLSIAMLIAPEACGAIDHGSGLFDATCLTISADGPAYLPWLATLPLAGALAAVLARSFGARPAQRLIAAIFPAIYLAVEAIVFGLGSPFYWRIPVYWVVIPAIVCAIGALPFMGSRRDSAGARTVSPAHS